jgi:hypothetical protein
MARRADAVLVLLLVMVPAELRAQTVANSGVNRITRDSLLQQAYNLASGLPPADKARL